jgi:F1F0 ATPase subunit 2
MTSERILLSAAAGLLLGLAFYGGLWLTVRRLAVTPHPFVWTMGSFLLRMALALAGFIWIADGRFEYALACLAGFVLGRLAASKAVALCT